MNEYQKTPNLSPAEQTVALLFTVHEFLVRDSLLSSKSIQEYLIRVATTEDLLDIIEQFDRSAELGWNTRQLIDGWSRPLEIQRFFAGSGSSFTWQLVSRGEDGILGTEDDFILQLYL